MTLSPDMCYRAIASKDARFDGRFFTGVRTTGVYCRPVCPARVPLRRNVAFFPSAAAAEAAGFRPCLRCRPESSPGTPAWLGTSSTVSRALRYIGAGALDEASVADLADRLGVGERHLRRLFLEHLGAAPLAVAVTRRVQMAKKLIDETSLPMIEIALHSGFPSVRRFNAAVRRAYGRTPTELRRRAPRAAPPSDVVLSVTYRPPFDWRRLAAYLGPRAIPGVEHVTPSVYARAVRMGDEVGVIRVRPSLKRNSLELHVPVVLARHLLLLVERTRRVFDLTADPGEIVPGLRSDAALAPRLRGRTDVRVPGAWSGFELAVRAILGQQVTVRGATTLAGRLVRTFGTPLPEPEEHVTHTFPGPERLVRARLERIGMPGARAQTVREVAREAAAGRLELDTSPDLDTVLERLSGIPGIGPWTANYIAMRALGEPDAFPAGDLGLRQAFATSGRAMDERTLERRAEAWRPWRAYAAMLLWTSPKA